MGEFTPATPQQLSWCNSSQTLVCWDSSELVLVGGNLVMHLVNIMYSAVRTGVPFEISVPSLKVVGGWSRVLREILFLLSVKHRIRCQSGWKFPLVSHHRDFNFPWTWQTTSDCTDTGGCNQGLRCGNDDGDFDSESYESRRRSFRTFI